MSDKTGWAWWFAQSEESPHQGPFDTREEAIDQGLFERCGENLTDDGRWVCTFQVTEARQDPLRIAEWIGADRLLERAEEDILGSDRVSYEFDDGPFFECSSEAEKDLRRRIERVCDEWQAAHNLAFHSNTFSETRNTERVTRELPDQAGFVAPARTPQEVASDV